MNQTPSLGITFRETMSGPFHLGAITADDGRRQGESARTDLTLRATVTIRDVRRFMHDRDQRGEITGTIDFEPLGRDLPATRGAFSLSSPPDRPRFRVIAYEVAFETHGTPYYLAGRKEVHDDPGFDPWTDATTLFAILHEGTDRTGPIVGAGVLTVGPSEFSRLVASMRVTEAASLGDRTLTLTAFGRFFLGQLWETYSAPPGGMRAAWGRVVRGVRAALGAQRD